MDYSLIKSNKDKWLLVYYAVLVFILASWTNMDSAPSFVFRIGFLLSVVAPLFIMPKAITWTVPVFVCLLTIAKFSFCYSYLPYETYYYTLLFGFIWVYAKTKRIKGIVYPITFYILFIYSLLINLLIDNEINNISISMLWILLLSFTINKEDDKSQLLLLSFVIASLVLSVLYLVMGREFAVQYSYGENIEVERDRWTDPNYFGTAISIGFISAFILLLKYQIKNRIITIVLVATIVLSSLALITNASRGSILSAIVPVAALVASSRIKIIYKIIIILAMAIVVYLFYRSGFFDLLIMRAEMLSDDGGSGRIDIWQMKLEAYRQLSIDEQLIGVGFNRSIVLGVNKGIHNDYLAFLVQYGILGALLFFVMMLEPLFSAPKKQKIVVLVLMLNLAITCFTLEPLTAGYFTFWASYMCIVALSKSVKLK